MIRRKLTKVTKEEMNLMKSKRKFKELLCKECGEEYVTVSNDIGKVTCAECIMKMVGGSGIVRKVAPEDKRPRGWHKKPQYTSPNGKKYVRGVEVENFPDEKISKSKSTETKSKPVDVKIKNEVKTIDEPKKKRGRPPKNKN